MNALSLCSGIGGLDLGIKLAAPEARTVAYVELEPFCQDVLLARMADGLLDLAPIWGDIRTLDAKPWRGLVDLVHGGYPCQPFSFAGRRRGGADPRHLWPHVARILGECRPEFAFFENVAGHLSLGFQEVAEDLEGLGYRVAAGLFTAAEVGAPHRRQRLYILARRCPWDGVADAGRGSLDTHKSGRGGRLGGASAPEPRCGGASMEHTICSRWAETRLGSEQYPGSEPQAGSRSMGHADQPRLEGRGEPRGHDADERDAWPPGPEERDQWARILSVWPDLAPATVADSARQRRGEAERHSEFEPIRSSGGGSTRHPGSRRNARRSAEGDATQPALRGMADGIRDRVVRLKALGNAVVPDVAALAWRTLMEAVRVEVAR